MLMRLPNVSDALPRNPVTGQLLTRKRQRELCERPRRVPHERSDGMTYVFLMVGDQLGLEGAS
jgi:hypothetical protein